MDSHLNVASDIKVKFLEKNFKYYLNRSTILFGASNSGKSTILIEILYLLKDHVPNIFVFAPTAEANNAFNGIIPGPLVFKTVEIDTLNEIYMRQQAATKIYNTVNNLTYLRRLFEQVADYKIIEVAKLAYNNANAIIQKKHNDTTINFIERRSSISEVKEVRDQYLSKLYKAVIRCNKSRLRKMGISEKSKYIIKYLDFNPNCVVVFDDCGAILKKFQKEEVVKKIIFQGRHNHINLILTLQDDLNLDSSIKKNAFVNIFTTGRCAAAYFERGSNSFSKKEKEVAGKIITSVFTPSVKRDFKKLVYLRDETNPFRYTIADIYENFRFGCPSLWEMCNKVSKENNTCDFENDPLLSSFKIDI
jgi:hypothetical protein